MAIVQTVNLYTFRRAFESMGRDNFSYKGQEWLFDYLEEWSEQADNFDIELDVIALCCEYQESTYEDVIRDYNVDVSECATPDEMVETVREYLENHTSIVGYDDATILFVQF